MGFFRSLSAMFSAPMQADAPAAKFSVDIPPDLLGLMTGNDAIEPRISRAEALQVPAVMRSRNLIAGTLGSLPLVTIGPDRREVEGTYLLGGNIDPDIPNSVVMAQTVEDLLFEGLSWWHVTAFGWHGFPVQARHVPHQSVSVSGSAGLPSESQISPDQPFPVDGQVFIDGYPMTDREIIRFDSPNPPLLRHAARAIRTALKLDRAAALYADDPLPLAVFTPKEGVDPGDRTYIQGLLDDWEQARSHRATGYVGAALNLETLGWSPEQLQLADARQHAVLEIARAAGVDPEDLGVSTTSRTYQNSEQRRQDLLDFTLGAYVTAIQDRLSMRDVLPRRYRAKVKFDAFLRSDTITRMKAYEIGQPIGAITHDEIRDAEDRPRLTPAEKAAIGAPTSARPQPQPEPADSDMEGDAMEPAAKFGRDLPDHWDFAVDTPPWGSITEADYTPEQYRRACLIDTGVGEVDSKARYKLPIKTPGGAVHRGGVHAAASVLAGGRGGVSASAEQKARAARALVRIYRSDLDEEPPESLLRMAGMAAAHDSAEVTFDDPEVLASFQIDHERRTIIGLAVPWEKVAKSGFSKWRFAADSLRWSDTSRVKLNLNHDRDQLIGRATRLQSGSRGLMATFKVADTPEGHRALSLAEDKILDGFSIEIDFDDEFGDEYMPDSSDKSINYVRQATLRGVALTGVPAFDDARVDAVAASRDKLKESANGRDEGHREGDGQQRGPVVEVQLRRVHQDPG